MSTRPKLAALAEALTGLDGLLWLAFGVVVAGGWHPALPAWPWYRAGLAVAALGLGLTLFGLVYFLRKRQPWAFSGALGVLGVIALLSFADDFGWVDFLFLWLILLPLVLLLKERNWYLAREPR